MPDHCYGGSSATELYLDYEAKFNWIPTETYNEPEDSDDLYDLLCQETSYIERFIPDDAGFVNYGNSTMSFTGIAVSGMSVSAPLNNEDQDPLYPNDGSDAVAVDTCLGHTNGYGYLHYHVMAPCVSVANSTLG